MNPDFERDGYLVVKNFIPRDSADMLCSLTLKAVADGVVLMGNIIRQGDLLRSLQVVKMRGTKHSRARHLIELTPVGLAVVPLLKWGQDGGQAFT